MSERLGPRIEPQLAPIEAPIRSAERGRMRVGVLAGVLTATTLFLALSLACKNAEDASPQTPNTSPAATAEISPTADFDFTIPPEKLVSWNEAHEFLVQIGAPFVDNEEITITALNAGLVEVAPAFIATIKHSLEYDSIKDKYTLILAEGFSPLNSCNIEVTDEYGTIVYRGIQWVTPDGSRGDSSNGILQPPNCN